MCRHNLADHFGIKCNPDSVIGHGVDEHPHMEKAIGEMLQVFNPNA